MGAPGRTAFACVGAVALSTFTVACASAGGATPRPFPGAPVPPASPPATIVAAPAEESPAPVPPAPDAATAAALVATALELLGVPYQNGGTSANGFDCSGFTQYVFAQHGWLLPREVRDQFNAGRSVDRDAVEAGDLLFFETAEKKDAASGSSRPGQPSHVGIALGGDTFVHAPSSTGVVRVERYTATYWARRFVGARRVKTN
jgi:cell wall-associated NlpC family hydrolase